MTLKRGTGEYKENKNNHVVSYLYTVQLYKTPFFYIMNKRPRIFPQHPVKNLATRTFRFANFVVR